MHSNMAPQLSGAQKTSSASLYTTSKENACGATLNSNPYSLPAFLCSNSLHTLLDSTAIQQLQSVFKSCNH